MELNRYTETSVSRDLKINLSRSLEKTLFTPVELYSLVLVGAVNLKDEEIITLAKEKLISLDLTASQIQDVVQANAIMGMLNIYYKTRFSLDSASEYEKADLRMQSLGNPSMGKRNFELLAFAVSSLNGCPYCVNSHEKALKALGVSTDQVHEIIRIMAVLKGLKELKDSGI